MFNSYFDAQSFTPSLAGIWLNSAYLTRRGIGEAVRRHAPLLSGRLLDYGCGSKPYESLFTVTSYVGADIEISGHPADLKRADIFFDGLSLPVGDKEFDSVLASEVFEHVFELRSCLTEIARVLKPGGRLLATCPFVWPLHEEPYDFARYTPHALKHELEAAGFRILIQERAGTSAEVLGQMFLADLLPSIFPRIRFVYKLIEIILSGLVNSTCRLSARVFPGSGKLYLNNVIVAEKL